MKFFEQTKHAVTKELRVRDFVRDGID